MFGVRIWLTPMHNTSSPAASLRLAWFSPTTLDMDVLLFTTFGHQAYDKPERSRRRSRRLLHLKKPTGSVEPDGAAVGGADRQVRAARTHVLNRSEPTVHQSPTNADPAQTRQKVDVQMRGIGPGDRARRAARMVDAVSHELVGAPSRARLIGRIAVELSEPRPPFDFQPALEVAGIRRTDDVAAYAMGVFGDKYGERADNGVGCGVNMPDQSGIAVEGGSVVAAGGRRQADAV